MVGQSDTNPQPEAVLVNVYPYTPIRLGLKELLSRFGERLGIDYVPLVLKWGTKRPYYDNWQRLSWKELCELNLPDGTFLAGLQQKNGRHNVGIRQGPNSGRLIGIDIDTNDRRVVDQLLLWCPFLTETLWTRGGTGHQMWVRIKGDYPAELIYLQVPGASGKKPGSPAVEIRAQDGLQSVVWGKHPDGAMYTVVNDKPVLEVTWPELTKWEWKTVREERKARTSRRERRWTNAPLAWQGDIKKRTRVVEDLGYKVIGASDNGHRLDVICVNEKNHSDDTGERQTSVFLGTDECGVVAYSCFHASCSQAEKGAESVNRRETERLKRAFARQETIFYAAGGDRIHETQTRAYEVMAGTKEFFNLNESAARWREGWEKVDNLNSLTVHAAISETGLKVSRESNGKIGPFRLLGEEASSLLANKPYIRQYLPRIRAVSSCGLYYQVKTSRRGALTAYGYNPDIEYLNLSRETIEPMSLEQAKEFLQKFFLCFFDFDTPMDRSRGISALISPGTLLGHWYEGRAPAQLLVADKRQAGKTFFLKLLAAIYNHDLILQDYHERSIGGVIERLQHELGRGSPFFAIDNIRGALDLPFVEIFTTGGSEVQFRGAYEKMRYADTTRMTLLLCGNEGFKITGDLASRCVITKILYRAGRTWRLEDGVSLAELVRENWPLYLGAIYGIIHAWAEAGAPRVVLTPEEVGGTDLRFIDYTEAHNGILKMLEEKPLTVGLAERQTRVSDPAIMFAEAAYDILETEGRLNQIGPPGVFGRFLEDSGLELPFHYRNNERSLTTQMGLLFCRLPTAGQDVNRFGKGYVHIITDSRTRQKSYYVSPSIDKGQTKDFEYAHYMNFG